MELIKKVKWFHVNSKSFMDYEKRDFKGKVWYWFHYPLVLVRFLHLMRGDKI